MSNNNDMELIMEAWRKAVNERTGDPTLFARGRQSQSPETAKLPPKSELPNVYDAIKTLEKEGGFWWFVINAVDITGVTAWPYVERSWNDYMEWYMLDDDDERKDKGVGSFLFAQFVLSVVLAIPMVDLIPKLMAKIGYEASEGLIKGILKELATAFTIFSGSAGVGGALALTQSDRYDKYRHGDALNKAREKKEQLEKKLKKLQRIEKDKKTIDAISHWKQKQKDRKED
jgi:hypothetical protein